MTLIEAILQDKTRLENENKALRCQLAWITGFLRGLAERVSPKEREDIHKALKVISREQE